MKLLLEQTERCYEDRSDSKANPPLTALLTAIRKLASPPKRLAIVLETGTYAMGITSMGTPFFHCWPRALESFLGEEKEDKIHIWAHTHNSLCRLNYRALVFHTSVSLGTQSAGSELHRIIQLPCSYNSSCGKGLTEIWDVKETRRVGDDLAVWKQGNNIQQFHWSPTYFL